MTDAASRIPPEKRTTGQQGPSPWTVSARELHRRRKYEEPAPRHERPKTRADCADGPRPCPFVGCRYHLALDVKDTGGLHFELGRDVELESMAETCALDVADQGPHSLDRVGELLNLTRERIRQLESRALRNLAEYVEQDPDDPEEIRFHTPEPEMKTGEALHALGLTKEKAWLSNLWKRLGMHGEMP